MKTKYYFEKYYFNPEDKAHRALLLNFINTSSWRPYCPFILEEPFTDIVSMCKHKTLQYYMDKDRIVNFSKKFVFVNNYDVYPSYCSNYKRFIN